MSTLFHEIGREVGRRSGKAPEKAAAGKASAEKAAAPFGGIGRVLGGLGRGLGSLVKSPTVGKALGVGAGLGYTGYRGYQALKGPQPQFQLPSNWDSQLSNNQIGEYAARNADVYNSAARDLRSSINQAWQGDDYEKALQLEGHLQAGRLQRRPASSGLFGDTPESWEAPPGQGVGGFFRNVGHALFPNAVDEAAPDPMAARQNLQNISGALDQRYHNATNALLRAPGAIRQRISVMEQQLAGGGLVGPDRAEAEQTLAMLRQTLQRASAAGTSPDLDAIRAVRSRYGLGQPPPAAPASNPYFRGLAADPSGLALFNQQNPAPAGPAAPAGPGAAAPGARP